MQIVSTRKDGAFKGQRRCAVFFDKDEDKVNGPSRSRAKPEFFKETQIDVIMSRATRTGIVPVKPNPKFGDFTSGNDLLTVQNRIIDLHKYFDSLPSATRDFFANSPANYLDFLADPKNRDRCVEMGLIQRPEPPAQPPAEKPKDAPVPSAPAVLSDAPTAPVA